MAKEIKLTQGEKAIVDDEDFEFLNQWKWHVSGGGKMRTRYAIRTCYENGKKTIWMHRLLFEMYGQKDFKEVDHIDRNGLNNQKSNLRHASRTENIMNTGSWGKSKYKGVSIWNKTIKGKLYSYYRVRISVNKKSIQIGLFKDEKEAAIQYNTAAKKYFGEYANLNIIQNG